MGQLNIALVALVVTCVSVAVIASALNAIAISQSAEPQRINLTHGSAAKFSGSAGYGIVMSLCRKARKHFRQNYCHWIDRAGIEGVLH